MNLKTAEVVANKLMKEFNVPKGWTFRFNNRKRSLGLCCYTTKTVELSRDFVRLNERSEIEDTIRHEIAHALVGPGHGHDAVWKRMAVRCGANPRACKRVDKQAKGKYTLMFGNEEVEQLHRRPKWINRVQDISISGRPETKGKLTLVRNY